MHELETPRFCFPPRTSLTPFQPLSCCKRRFPSDTRNTNLPCSSPSRLKGAEVVAYGPSQEEAAPPSPLESAPSCPALARKRSRRRWGTSPWFSSEPHSLLSLRLNVERSRGESLHAYVFSKYAFVVKTFWLIFLLELLNS